MTDRPRVLLEVSNRIAHVTLNRPDKHNGLDAGMFRELVDTARAVRRNLGIRCVILHGSGPSFCAGLDMAAVARTPSMVVRFFAKLPWSPHNMFQRAAHVWRELPIPVIAAIHGNCLGGGLQIALACDVRIATPDSRFAIMESQWGLIPDMSATVTLSRLTRVDIAQELTMTGRVFSGEQAADYGLVTRLDETPLQAAQALAATLCQRSPDAVAASKYLFRKTWKKDTRGALLWERITQLRLLGRSNQKIAMKAGIEGDSETPAFVDRENFR